MMAEGRILYFFKGAYDNPAARLFLLRLTVIFGLVLADQISKWAVFEKLLRHQGEAAGFFDWLTTARSFLSYEAARGQFQDIFLLPFLNFVMVWNTGVSFGLFSSSATIILILLALVIAAVLLVWLYRTQDHRRQAAALMLLTSGALGNVLDRLRFGAVADFIDVHAFGWHWPAFNVADSLVVVGAGLLILDSFLKDKEKKK